MTDVDVIVPFVVGFCFKTSRDEVLLIKKNRPDSLAGYLNGVGGHIEPNETPVAAMSREFYEETGYTFLLEWQDVMCMIGINQVVHYFCCFNDKAYFLAQDETDETLVRIKVSDLFDKTFTLPIMPDLRVAIPLALDTSGIVKPVILTTLFRLE